MPSRAHAKAPGRARRARSRRAVAWACSIVLHGGAIYVASRLAWQVVEPSPVSPASVVWLETVTVPAPPPPDSEAQAPVDASESAAAEAGVEPESVSSSSQARESSEEVAETEDDEAEFSDDARPPEDESPPRRSRTIIVREVDWEEERRRAVARVREELARTRDYPTFSLEDYEEAPLPQEPGPTEDIFTAASRGGGGGPALLTPGRSGGPVGRGITALCDVLGGVGLSMFGFGVGSICAEAEPGYALFSHIKPEYLRARPECVEVPGAEVPASIDIEGPIFKCRLVDPAGPRPADEGSTSETFAAPAQRPATAGGVP